MVGSTRILNQAVFDPSTDNKLTWPKLGRNCYSLRIPSCWGGWETVASLPLEWSYLVPARSTFHRSAKSPRSCPPQNYFYSRRPVTGVCLPAGAPTPRAGTDRRRKDKHVIRQFMR